MANAGVVYARPARSADDATPLTFGVSGRLWRDTLVMFDRETRTLWSQLLGRGIHGELKGAALREVPFTRTTWGEWKGLHPGTLALAKPAGVTRSAYQGYFEDPERMGVTGRDLADRRLPGKSLVFGLVWGGKAVAVPLAAGVRDTVEVRLDGQTILVERDGERASARTAEDEEAVAGLTTYWFAWASFYPDTDIASAEEDEPRTRPARR